MNTAYFINISKKKFFQFFIPAPLKQAVQTCRKKLCYIINRQNNTDFRCVDKLPPVPLFFFPTSYSSYYNGYRLLSQDRNGTGYRKIDWTKGYIFAIIQRITDVRTKDINESKRNRRGIS